MTASSVEQQRLLTDSKNWQRWGPYLSERAWGTVREDYSANGAAWEYLPHDQARSKIYRWNEDGLAGICDNHQHLCFALALWNGHDPILKERLFGLTGPEGNHGEDVKEYYFYLDSTPTHSYMRMLYKYPQAAFPYARLVDENRRRSKDQGEFELLDTGIFDEDRYFDVFVEYAKAQPDDILIRIQVANRGPEAASVSVLPTLWFRNTWSWGRDDRKPILRADRLDDGTQVIRAQHADLGEYALYCENAGALLFTENETNTARLYNVPNATPFVKDAFHEYVVAGNNGAVNPAQVGTKAAAHYVRSVNAGESLTIRLRLTNRSYSQPFADFDLRFDERQREADEYYNALQPATLTEDERR